MGWRVFSRSISFFFFCDFLNWHGLLESFLEKLWYTVIKIIITKLTNSINKMIKIDINALRHH